MIYLNDGEGLDFNGGETLFLDARNLKTNPDTADALGVDAAAAAEAAVAAVAAGAGPDAASGNGDGDAAKAPVVVSVPPRMGRVTVFEHALYHSGARLKDGEGRLLGGGGGGGGGDGGADGSGVGGGDGDGGAEARGISAGCKLVVRTDIMFETKATAGSKANAGAEGGAAAGGLVFGRDDATFGNEDVLGGGGGAGGDDASR